MVRSVLNTCLFNSLHADSVITALENHARKYNKLSEIYEQKPSKTKFRDLADTFRHCAVDYGTKEYLQHLQNQQVIRMQHVTAQGPPPVEINGVEHSFAGSMMYRNDGSELRGNEQEQYGNVPTHLSYG